MTILQTFKAVKNSVLREKLLKNYDPDFHYNADDTWVTPGSSLSYGFSWAGSPEAFLYWQTLHDYIMKNQCSLDAAYAKVHGHGGSVPDMPSIPPPPKPDVIAKGKGKEYMYCTSKNNIIVQQFMDNKLIWKATFDIRSFIAWAKENT